MSETQQEKQEKTIAPEDIKFVLKEDEKIFCET